MRLACHLPLRAHAAASGTSRLPLYNTTQVWDLSIGAAAGVASVLVSMPLDVVKTYIQTHGADVAATAPGLGGQVRGGRRSPGHLTAAAGGTGSLPLCWQLAGCCVGACCAGVRLAGACSAGAGGWCAGMHAAQPTACPRCPAWCACHRLRRSGRPALAWWRAAALARCSWAWCRALCSRCPAPPSAGGRLSARARCWNHTPRRERAHCSSVWPCMLVCYCAVNAGVMELWRLRSAMRVAGAVGPAQQHACCACVHAACTDSSCDPVGLAALISSARVIARVGRWLLSAPHASDLHSCDSACIAALRIRRDRLCAFCPARSGMLPSVTLHACAWPVPHVPWPLRHA